MANEETRHVSFNAGRYYCLKEVAQLLGVTERTVQNWIASGQLRAYKLGPAKNAPVRIHGKSLRNFLVRVSAPKEKRPAENGKKRRLKRKEPKE